MLSGPTGSPFPYLSTYLPTYRMLPCLDNDAEFCLDMDGPDPWPEVCRACAVIVYQHTYTEKSTTASISFRPMTDRSSFSILFVTYLHSKQPKPQGQYFQQMRGLVVRQRHNVLCKKYPSPHTACFLIRPVECPDDFYRQIVAVCMYVCMYMKTTEYRG